MAFVVSAAATAASAAAFVAAGGVAAGSAAVTAATVGSVVGGGLAAGAVGAGLGAITSAATGQDIGKGALMGGVGGALTGGMASGLSSGLGAAASGTGASTAIGAASGAAGGAAGAAAGGEDPLKGAAFGGAAGGIGGYMKGVDAGQLTPSGSQEINDIGKTPLQAQASTQSSPLIEGANIPQSSGAAINNIPTNAAQYSSLPASDMSGITPPSTDIMDKGIKLIKDNPAVAMQLGGAAMNMMGGTSSKQQPQAPATASIYDPIPYTQQDIPKTTVPDYYNTDVGYAFGGSVTDSSQQGQMNPIVARAMQQIQQAQPQAQQPVQPQQTPAPQGIMGAQPMPQVKPAQPVQQPAQPLPQTQPTQMAAAGGMMRDNLGGYSHGGIAGLTRGPGTGISDDIPAQIGDSGKQPARLADGEFVVPSRIVSELGQGSTEAGAKMLQAMVNKIQARRSKTIGKGKVAADSKASKELPA
jgi:hypothetical protein